MDQYFAYTDFEQAAAVVRGKTDFHPRVGLILGSGLSGLAQAVEDATAIPYAQIPNFPVSTVEGHAGHLVIGILEGQPVVVMQGRSHYYEGYSMAQVTFPVRVMQVLGIEILIVTNAAGGLNPDFKAGEIMVLKDHLNLMGMAGLSPLRGPNIDQLGPRFPDMSQPYDPELRQVALEVSAEQSVPVREGVYVALGGPNYETPSDMRFLRLVGVDAVGMSTVPEVIIARHAGTRVLGLSAISNVLPVEGGPSFETTHEEVLQTGKLVVPRLETIIRGVLRAL